MTSIEDGCRKPTAFVTGAAASFVLIAAMLLRPTAARAEQASGPSFDCGGAAAPAEQRICELPDLAALDVEVAHAYAARLAGLSRTEAARLGREQHLWLRRRDLCGGRDACLRDAMQSRLAALGGASGSPPPVMPQPPAEAGAPPVQPALNAHEQALAAARAIGEARAAEARARVEARERKIGAMREARAREAAANAPVDDTTPAGDEWRGAYVCSGADAFMRLVLLGAPDTAGRVAAVLETGPAPDGAAARASFRVAGTFAPDVGALHLEPEAWVHRPYASDLQTFGLDGARAADGRLSGKVLGPVDCSGFRAWHVAPDTSPENPDGLLSKVSSSSDLSMDDCRLYARWLASGHELHIASYYVSSLVYDAEGQRRVLGRTAEQWRPDDHLRYRAIASTCQGMMSKSALLEDSALVRKISLFSIAPFDRPKLNWIDPEWDRAELAPLLRGEAQARAAARLAELAALPPSWESYAVIDREAAAAAGMPADLRYLEDGDRAEYKRQVAAQRPALGRAIAAAMANRFRALPPTTENLEAMKTEAASTRDMLLRAHDPDAARLAEESGRQVAADTARQVWPLFLADAGARLKALDGAGYDRFPDVLVLRRRETVLRAADAPPDAAAASAYVAAYAAVIDSMVTRSEAGLVAWAEALPPSASANRKLDAFTSLTFGGAGVPERFPALRAAVEAKRRAYNPDGYRRPDIVMSLQRHLWPEVSAEGLEDISYFATALHALNEQCPGLMPPEGSPESLVLVNYALQATRRAVDRLMRGEVRNETEKQRAALLAINTFFNRPGCRTDGFGNVTSCTSLEDQSKAQAAILTSDDAVADMHALGAHGCGSPQVTGYVQASVDYAAHHRDERSGIIEAPDAWTAVSPR